MRVIILVIMVMIMVLEVMVVMLNPWSVVFTIVWLWSVIIKVGHVRF